MSMLGLLQCNVTLTFEYLHEYLFTTEPSTGIPIDDTASKNWFLTIEGTKPAVGQKNCWLTCSIKQHQLFGFVLQSSVDAHLKGKGFPAWQCWWHAVWTHTLEKGQCWHLESTNSVLTGGRTGSEWVLIRYYLWLWTGAGREHLQATE